jgi:hypothetical protein
MFRIIHHLPLLINGHVGHVITKVQRTLDLLEQHLDLLVVVWSGKVKFLPMYPVPDGVEGTANMGRMMVLGGRIGDNGTGVH